MKKLLLIGLKDVKLALRDMTALAFMLLAPFLLTLGMGFVTGALGRSSASGIDQIPVLLVNQDEGEIGGMLVTMFTSADLADLLAPTVSTDPAAARLGVDNNEASAAIIIPAGFTASITSAQEQASAEVVKIEIYKNPQAPVSAGIVQSIVEEFLSRVETGRIEVQVIVTQLVSAGLVPPDQVNTLAQELGARQAQAVDKEPAILLSSAQSGEAQNTFNVMAYMAPGMALMFLMYTTSNGGRTILLEQARGTLPRLLVSPTNSAQILIGKVFGIFLTGVLQVLILIVTCSLLFGLHWGDPLGVFVLVLAAVFAATGWGMLLTAIVRTPGQASSIGTALMLTFGILGGSFIQVSILPGWFQLLSKITPNAWGITGFTQLAMGLKLADLGGTLLALLVMGVVLGFIAILLFNRRSAGQK
jgi:linearmycin/streptolysin S transport system permease protein